MDSGTNTQTTSTTNEPYKAAQPTIDRALSMANSVADSGQAFAPNTESNVVPWASNTIYGRDTISNLAYRQNQSDGITGEYQRAISRGGFNAPQMTSIQSLTRTATNPFDITADPAYMRMRGAVADDVQNRVNENASGVGRYNSGAHTGALAKTLGDTLASMDTDQLTRMQGRQDAATRDLFNAGQQGFGNLSAAYEGMKLPSQDQLNLGAMEEDLSARQINDRNRILEDTRLSDLRKAEWLMGIGSGAGSLGGTSTGTAQTPGQNPFASALGYGATGLGMLGSARNLGWF